MSFSHQQVTRNNYVFEGFNATQKVNEIANETKKICMKSGKNEKKELHMRQKGFSIEFIESLNFFQTIYEQCF